jgi:hypothetical protein
MYVSNGYAWYVQILVFIQCSSNKRIGIANGHRRDLTNGNNNVADRGSLMKCKMQTIKLQSCNPTMSAALAPVSQHGDR